MQPEEQPFSVDYTSGAIARAGLLLINGNLFQESVVDHLWKASYQTLGGGLRLTRWAQGTTILLPRLDCRGYPAQQSGASAPEGPAQKGASRHAI